MKTVVLLAGAIMMAALPAQGWAQERYVEPPPVLVSPDLSAPWVMQLRRQPVERVRRPARVERQQPALRGVRRDVAVGIAAEPLRRRPAARQAPGRVQTRAVPRQETVRVQRASVAAGAARESRNSLDPKFLPQEVAYHGPEKPGTIVIDTSDKFLYLVQADGKARRYGVGVGKEGFMWKGSETISQKREWPDWRPPAEMIAREKKKGRVLPAHMEGGPANPLGARALYLGSTLYRIHGTNAPWTIGQNVSSGCIRMRNDDVVDLYERVGVGTRVVVI